jgi:lipid-binding SYLF domain-containing protein
LIDFTLTHKMEIPMKRILAAVLVAVTLPALASAQSVEKLDNRIEAAHEVLHELMATPDKGIPFDIASHATCVAVIPGYKKGAFVIGGQYGQGVATCRTGHGWSAPVFVQITGASFGFQAGGQETDLVLVGVTRHSMDAILKEKVKLGGDLAATAGPVGRNSQAGTAILANAGFLTYSRSRGIFAGVDLTGDELHQNQDDTRAYYGSDIPYQRILGGGVPVKPSSRHFVATVGEMFRIGRARQ